MSEIRYYGRCIIARETGLSPSAGDGIYEGSFETVARRIEAVG